MISACLALWLIFLEFYIVFGSGWSRNLGKAVSTKAGSLITREKMWSRWLRAQIA